MVWVNVQENVIPKIIFLLFFSRYIYAVPITQQLVSILFPDSHFPRKQIYPVHGHLTHHECLRGLFRAINITDAKLPEWLTEVVKQAINKVNLESRCVVADTRTSTNSLEYKNVEQSRKESAVQKAEMNREDEG